jgi:hypothetical protein
MELIIIAEEEKQCAVQSEVVGIIWYLQLHTHSNRIQESEHRLLCTYYAFVSVQTTKGKSIILY